MGLMKRKRNRCVNWNYSSNGYYFVTVLVDRKYCLGKIIDNKVILNKLGITVKNCWLVLPKFVAKMEIDEFVIMPDHFHGIVRLFGLKKDIEDNKKSMYLSKVIRSFKTAVSIKLGLKIWQRSYFDKIIRDKQALEVIRKYIRDNPTNFDPVLN